MRRIHRNLMRNLIDIPVRIERKEIQIDRLPIVQCQNILIPEDSRRIINRMVIQMDQDTPPLRITERIRPLHLRQLRRIKRRNLPPGIPNHIIIILQISILISDGFKPVYELRFDLVL